MDYQSLGKRVLKRRKELGSTQFELARLTKVSRNYLAIIERGEVPNISIRIVEKLAAVLGIYPAELLGWSKEEEFYIPASLREYGLQDELAFDEIDRLSRIPKRGKEPSTPEEWRLLHNTVRQYWQAD